MLGGGRGDGEGEERREMEEERGKGGEVGRTEAEQDWKGREDKQYGDWEEGDWGLRREIAVERDRM